MTEDSAAVTLVNKEWRGPIPMDPNKKVAIVGFASSSRNLAPYADESFEVWGLNHGYFHVPEARWQRWFEIHPRAHVLKDVTRNGSTLKGPDHFEWLRKWPRERGIIYMQEHLEEIPASVAWPREEINAWFRSLGHDDTKLYAPDYYTSSISQMLATAMYDGYGVIHLYGVDLLQNEEYFYQRAGCEYLIGLARGMGYKVLVPNESALCKATYTYGYSELPDPTKNDKLINYVEARQKECEVNKPKLIGQIESVNSMAQLTSVVRDNWIVKSHDRVTSTLTSLDEATKEHVFRALDAMRTELQKCAQEQMASFNQTRLTLAQQIGSVEGQESAFGCVVSWAQHDQRGGALGSVA